MAAAEIIEQLQVLVLDLSNVVSYKWLSRKFSVSSNAAKRILQEFADKHGDGIEIVHVVSGWTQAEPPSYSVQLVHGKKLQEAKALLVGEPSIHIYSVQASLPTDPAQLCSPDILQAEELFNQAPDVNNCLRDNRFSGVSCSLVTRKLKGTFHPAPATASTVAAPSTVEQAPTSSKAEQPRDGSPEQPSSSFDNKSSQVLNLGKVAAEQQNGRGKAAAEQLNGRSRVAAPSPSLDNGPKKRKILRTRVDERGREVTEVIWEMEGAEEAKKEAPPAVKSDPPPKQQVSASAKPPPPKPAAKQGSSSKVAAGKSGKGGKGAQQQGNITSFFKKQQ